jgi:hypothetical protein
MGIILGGGNIFGRVRYERIRQHLGVVTVGEVCEEEGIKNKDDINRILGIQLTDVEYGKLRDCIKHLRKKYKPEWDLKEMGKTIREWLEPIKKGAKSIET